MKKIFAAAIVSILFGTITFAQNTLPSVKVKTLEGESIDISQVSNDGKPIIISFWATWCKPCIRELSAINDMYVDWQEETGVKVIAVSIDDARNSAKVNPFVNGLGWEYEVYLDDNNDLKRALNVNTIPHTFLLNGDKEVVWQHNGYNPGDEEELYELVQKLSFGLPIDEH